MKKIRITYTLRAPLSHIGETASTGSYFQTVLTSGGRLPVITGNSVRGQLRDSAAKHLLNTMSAGGAPVKVDKDTFNILFSGGNLNGTMKDDVEKAKQVRAHFPMLSLLGGGLGDMLLSGKLICGFVYPVCREAEDITGIESDRSWHDLIEEMEFTRMDDAKDETLEKYLLDATEEKTAKASTQMRYSVQYLAAGTQLVQDLILLDGTTDLELGALYAAFAKWWEVPRLGGMSAKGFGLFRAMMRECGTGMIFQMFVNGKMVVEKNNDAECLIDKYNEFVREEGTQYLNLLSSKKAKAKHGKAAGASD